MNLNCAKGSDTMAEITYPSVEEIEKCNVFVLGLIQAKKGDKPQVLSKAKIRDAIAACEEAEGDICDKAAVLVRQLVSGHAFASGNRRTAFVAGKEFVIRNGGAFKIEDTPIYAKVMLKIREGRYSDREIAEWIRHGKIRE